MDLTPHDVVLEDVLNDGDEVLATVRWALLYYSIPFYNKTPYHTCPFTGLHWVDDLMGGHPEHIHHELGVHLHVFLRLLNILGKMGYSDSQHIMLREQVAIFLYACRTGLSTHFLGERFQHSSDTISKYSFVFFASVLLTLF